MHPLHAHPPPPSLSPAPRTRTAGCSPPSSPPPRAARAVYCATANPTEVLLCATGPEKKGIIGVVDGLCPNAIEDEGDQEKRKGFLRMIGYKR